MKNENFSLKNKKVKRRYSSNKFQFFIKDNFAIQHNEIFHLKLVFLVYQTDKYFEVYVLFMTILYHKANLEIVTDTIVLLRITNSKFTSCKFYLNTKFSIV